MWDLLGPGIEPMSPELADGFFTTEPPGKPQEILSYSFFVDCLETASLRLLSLEPGQSVDHATKLQLLQ